MADAVSRAGRHARAVSRFKWNPGRGLVPPPASETATVSFIKIEGRTYAVTARHVLESFDDLARKEGVPFEGYACINSPGVAISPPFLTPPPGFGQRQPDIAIRPIDERLPAHVGKAAFEILPGGNARWPIEFAVAVGFPTAEKHDIQDERGLTRLAMPCVHAFAEGLGSPGTSDQVQFHSELPERPLVTSLSGMSGGPVFWSDAENYGMLGFVKEALDVTPKEGEETFYTEPKVNFICQRVDFEILTRWAEFVDANWPAAVEHLNEQVRNFQITSRRGET